MPDPYRPDPHRPDPQRPGPNRPRPYRTRSRSSLPATVRSACGGLAAAALTLAILLPGHALAQEPDHEASGDRLSRLLPEVEAGVTARADLVQQIIDHVFSFAELGFQEYETSRYLAGVLREHGFEVEEGISGIPTAWWARWGSDRPVISFGSDIDGIPRASQRPGVAYHDPLVPEGPGHGEGHNSGQAVNIVAAIALKEVMEREGIPGTLVLWPGVAEELVATKAWLVRDGWFDDVDAALFTHVGNNLGVSWGGDRGTGLVSIEFTFHGEAAHSAGSPWRGRSALDGVELMNAGWNYWREHMRPLQRSHHVITEGGDQPNVVPSRASVWYYVREMDYPHLRENLDAALRMAEGAALMSDTRVEHRILGQAWPRHFNRPIAEVVWEHIEAVGLPEWTEDDEALAMAVQMEVGSEPVGLARELRGITGPPEQPQSGGSDDIGDISWTVPTITLTYPSNIPGLPGHHWSNAITMATPIAHKGAEAGARVLARATLELLLRPEILDDARDYFANVQTARQRYITFIPDDTPPATFLNREVMERFRPLLEPFHYDATRYASYLEQLGVSYPGLRDDQWERVREAMERRSAAGGR